ncbi:MAG TPA: hypothetical protein DEO33_05275 [Rikenellaceae bacterium]|nr:hypothetical protein [Rikenellaceae bacterium]
MQAEVATDTPALAAWCKGSGSPQYPDSAASRALLESDRFNSAVVASRLAKWMVVAIPEGLTVFIFPKSYHQRIQTSKMLERVIQKIKRRTRVTRIFPK